ncbi:flagellar hook protein FlgE [Fusibacter bizertensis]|uniref:Flagellar hook protein FlgE n=1 Tax=Fusibacter bizertensis TaxID=1488331 RepID=A0ABT6N884_9FIRM|nr:flagellar hook protein FlgE [Fusibacter bizertensis]MDH8676626.1 flagellar hook protein FlgE [Fusibacter bizertensis]
MMRSMFSGVSSLRAHQLRMDVIGNNIANVNTVGFKASSVSFSEMYSQTLKGASSSSDSRGGTNPMQVGLGANVASIAVNHSKGSIQRTDVATDLMIDGSGFFVVTNDANAQNKYYTRAGNFQMDEQGYLVTTEGLKVLDVNMKPIQVNMSDTKNATATTNLTISGNLNFTDTNYTTTADLYDSLGDVHTINVNFKNAPLITTAKKTVDPNDPKYDPAASAAVYNYSYREITISNTAGTQVYPDPAASATTAGHIYAKFNESGEIVDLVTLNTLADPDSTPDVSVSGTLTMTVPGAADITIPLDRSMFFANADIAGGVRTFTQVSKESDAKGVQLNGNSAGSIDTFNISSKGEIIGIYTNGERKVLQTLGLVDFDNPAGLEKIGGNLFQNTPNSGTPKYGAPATGSFGAVTPGALEMSNVDLAAQFTDMITTQRGFQANSRVITTSDEILQELVNLKR